MDMVAIPTVGRSPYAVGLYRTILQSLESIPIMTVIMANDTDRWSIVVDQLDEAGLTSSAHLVDTSGQNLTEQWATAAAMAVRTGCRRLHLFNDDVVLRSGAIPAMSTAMKIHHNFAMVGYDYFDNRPEEVVSFEGLQPVRGTYRDGGIGGFAFAVQTFHPLLPSPDPQFEWWGGDDDWVWQTLELGGLCAIARGIPVRHPTPETSAIHYPELNEAKARDHARLLAKWGKAW